MRLGQTCILTATVVCLAQAPALAIPLGGLYVQPLSAKAVAIQTVAPRGYVEVDYVPTIPRFSGTGQMQILEAAARVPLPILSAPLDLKGLLGYRQQWAFYSGSAEDTYGAIDLGLEAKLPLSTIPHLGGFLEPFSLYGFGVGDRLIIAKANTVGFATGGLTLPEYGGGVAYKLPVGSSITLGFESWSVPAELGTGKASFSGQVKTFPGIAVGYKW